MEALKKEPALMQLGIVQLGIVQLPSGDEPLRDRWWRPGPVEDESARPC